MQPVFMSIDCEETGMRIKKLIRENGYSVKDIQEAMGFENPQAVYKWLRGESLPSIDNLLILGKILNTKLENILAINGGDVVILRQIILNRRFNDKSPLLSYTLSQKRERRYGNESHISPCQQNDQAAGRGKRILEQVKADFEKIREKIFNMQLVLDKYNQTHEFEIEM